MNSNHSSHTAYTYIHYTTLECTAIDLSRSYTQTAENVLFHSPNGLWLSVSGDNDWEAYCLKNAYRLEKLQSQFQITLKPAARILVLHNEASFKAFEQEFAYYPEGIDRKGDNYTLQLSIHWERILTAYQGLVVSDAMPKLYNMGVWYDTWCCTSACIWDLEAVDKAEKQE